jgi:hypothetical protein
MGRFGFDRKTLQGAEGRHATLRLNRLFEDDAVSRLSARGRQRCEHRKQRNQCDYRT